MNRNELDELVGLTVQEAELLVRKAGLEPQSGPLGEARISLALPANVVQLNFDNDNFVVSADTQSTIDSSAKKIPDFVTKNPNYAVCPQWPASKLEAAKKYIEELDIDQNAIPKYSFGAILPENVVEQEPLPKLEPLKRVGYSSDDLKPNPSPWW